MNEGRAEPEVEVIDLSGSPPDEKPQTSQQPTEPEIQFVARPKAVMSLEVGLTVRDLSLLAALVEHLQTQPFERASGYDEVNVQTVANFMLRYGMNAYRQLVQAQMMAQLAEEMQQSGHEMEGEE